MAAPRLSFQLCVAVALAVTLCHVAVAQSGCTSVLMGLSPCLSYVSGNASTPSSSCCSKLADVVQSQPGCLCAALSSNAASSLGITINETLAKSLPGACKVKTPSPTQCKGATESLDHTSDDDVNMSTQTKPSFPEGASSKSVSGAGAYASGGSVRENTIPFRLAISILLAASCLFV